MRRIGLAFTVVAGLLAALTNSARADVVFGFFQTSSNPPGFVSASGYVAISDEAYREGWQISLRGDQIWNNLPSVDWGGLTDLRFQVAFNRGVTCDEPLGWVQSPCGMAITLADMQTRPVLYNGWSLDLAAGPNGRLVGSLFYNQPLVGDQTAFQVFFNGPNSWGQTGSDSTTNSGICALSGGTWTKACLFYGETVTVPEPMSFALFATGLLGLGITGLKRRSRA